VHLSRYVVKCTVTDSPFNIQATCSTFPPSALIHFVIRVTRKLVILRSPAAVLILLVTLRIRCSNTFLVFTLC